MLRKTVNRVRELRQRNGWSARQLADAVTARSGAKVSSSTVLKLEKGDVPLTDRWRACLADALDVEADRLEHADEAGASGVPVVSWADYVARRVPADAPQLPWRGRSDGLIALPARARDADAATGILRGDLLIVRRNPAPGDLAAGATVIALDGDGAPFLTRTPTAAFVTAKVVELRRPLAG